MVNLIFGAAFVILIALIINDGVEEKRDEEYYRDLIIVGAPNWCEYAIDNDELTDAVITDCFGHTIGE